MACVTNQAARHVTHPQAVPRHFEKNNGISSCYVLYIHTYIRLANLRERRYMQVTLLICTYLVRASGAWCLLCSYIDGGSPVYKSDCSGLGLELAEYSVPEKYIYSENTHTTSVSFRNRNRNRIRLDIRGCLSTATARIPTLRYRYPTRYPYPDRHSFR